MDTSETYIKMCEKAEEIQEVMSKYKGHLEPPDDGSYYRTDPYPVAIIYDNTLRCPTCMAYLTTPFCPKDGAEASTLGKYHLMFGGPCKKDLDECRIIWLPRQDQLQEMIFQLGEGVMAQVTLLVEYVKKQHPLVPSMEQLWLAFCMSEKYGKIWSGTEWIKK